MFARIAPSDFGWGNFNPDELDLRDKDDDTIDGLIQAWRADETAREQQEKWRHDGNGGGRTASGR